MHTCIHNQKATVYDRGSKGCSPSKRFEHHTHIRSCHSCNCALSTIHMFALAIPATVSWAPYTCLFLPFLHLCPHAYALEHLQGLPEPYSQTGHAHTFWDDGSPCCQFHTCTAFTWCWQLCTRARAVFPAQLLGQTRLLCMTAWWGAGPVWALVKHFALMLTNLHLLNFRFYLYCYLSASSVIFLHQLLPFLHHLMTSLSS